MIALLAGVLVAGAVEVEPSGELRVIESMPSTWTVDADGRTTEWGPVLDTRARVGVAASDGPLRGGAELDALSGQVAGVTWGLSELDERGRHTLDAASLDGLALRKLYVGARLPILDIEAGVVTSHWGLGLVANDGAHDQEFGRVDFGDRVARVRLATQPLGADVPFLVAIMGDRVLADELARQSEGDEAWQAVAGGLWRGETEELGLYGVIRRQLNDEGRFVHAHVADVYGRIERPVGEDWTLHAAAEAAMILGRTDISRTLQSTDGVRVRSAGAVGRVAAEHERARGVLRVAVASGDRTPDDDTLADFRFDRDLNVGLVLFDEVLGSIDLAAIDAASDPEVSAVPTEGVQNLAAEGAFRSAFALQPVVAAQPIEPVEVRLGAVFAWSTAPIAHPVESFRNGGVPTNHLGVPSSGRYMGTELDWAVATVEPETTLRPSLELQGGHALLSASLSGGVARVDHLLLTGRLRW